MWVAEKQVVTLQWLMSKLAQKIHVSYSYIQCVGTSLICFDFHPLCYAAVLYKFTYYAQYYAQEQELL